MPIATQRSFKKMLQREAELKETKTKPGSRKGGEVSAEAGPPPSALGPFKGGSGPCSPKYTLGGDAEAMAEYVMSLPNSQDIAGLVIKRFGAKFGGNLSTPQGIAQSMALAEAEGNPAGPFGLLSALLKEILGEALQGGYAKTMGVDTYDLCGPEASQVKFIIDSLKVLSNWSGVRAGLQMKQARKAPPPPARVTQQLGREKVALSRHAKQSAQKEAAQRTLGTAKQVEAMQKQTVEAAKEIVKSAVAAKKQGADALAAHLFQMAAQMIEDSKQHSRQAEKLRSYGTMLQTGHVDFSPLHGFLDTPVPSQKFVYGLNPALLRAIGAAYVGYRSYQAYTTPVKPAWVEAAIGAAAGAYAPVIASLGAAFFLSMFSQRGGAIRA